MNLTYDNGKTDTMRQLANKGRAYKGDLATACKIESARLTAFLDGKPAPEELALLEPFRGKVPEEVFGDPYLPPVSDGSGATPSEADVARLVFQVGPSSQVSVGQSFTVRVALVDAAGNIVPLSGVFVYLGLFREGNDTPSNDFLEGEKFEDTTNGVAEFDIQVQQAGAWRLRALTDDLPSHQPHGPEPYLFSQVFTVQ